MLRKMAKKIKIHIFRFRPTFSMLSEKVDSLQKCKKHLCCNLFWLLQKYLYFDWAIYVPFKIISAHMRRANQ